MNQSRDIHLSSEREAARREAEMGDILELRWLEQRDSDDADAMNAMAVQAGEAPWMFPNNPS